MAYVGTASVRGSARETLASVIAGEAGNEGLRGMRAVASVIQNRAGQNFSGYGNSYVAQATARNQFQGQATPTQASYRVADELLSGNLQDETGGALYYANPGASTARWATRLDNSNSLQIGNHYFTDNTNGVPFTGNGAASTNGDGTPYTGGENSDLFQGDPSTAQDDGAPLGWSSPSTDPRWGQADANGDGNVTVTELKQYNEAQAAARAAGSAQAGHAGSARNIPTAIVTAGNQQAQAMASAARTEAAAATANTASTNAANASIVGGFTNWLGGRVLQIFVFILAAIFVLVGLYFFAPKATAVLQEAT